MAATVSRFMAPASDRLRPQASQEMWMPARPAELRPALNSETFFETLYGLARDGKTDENGVPNFLQQAVTLNGIQGRDLHRLSARTGAEGALGDPRSAG